MQKLSTLIERQLAPGFAHELVAEQATRTPSRLAVACGGRSLTYEELNRRADRLAAHLKDLGAANRLVAIAVERSLEMVVGILGVLKAGAAYVPLDPGYPKDRLAFMMTDSQPAILLTQSHLLGTLPQSQAPTLLLDALFYASRNKHGGIAREDCASDLAYVIYTSGSTGKPKGVMITRGNLSAYLHSIQRATGVSADDVYLHTASVSFSSSVRQLLLPLSVGAGVVVATADELASPLSLFATIKEKNVTVIDLVPSYWRSCIDALRSLAGEARAELLQNELRLVLSASEPLLSDLPRAWRFELGHPAELINMFGQTETTGIVATHPIVPERVGGVNLVPLGRSIDDARIYLLDADLHLVEPGNAGEICIGGATVGKGYLNQPELSFERFPRDPFAENANARLYRTGDLGSLRQDGTLEFHGRVDDQLKVRGHRVEPAETEAALRQALASTPRQSESGKGFVVPHSTVEEQLARIWREVLKRDSISTKDNFFDLGGDSILVMQIASRAAKVGLRLTPKQIFKYQTIFELATMVTTMGTWVALG